MERFPRVFCVIEHHRGDAVAQVAGVRGRSELVGNDAHVRMGAPEPEHGIYEILRFGIPSVQPARAYDDRLRTFFLCEHFSCVFRHSIGVYGVRLVVGGISPRTGSVEHVIRGYGYEAASDRRTGFCQMVGPHRVDVDVVFTSYVLGVVHFGIRGAIYDEIGLYRLYRTHDGIHIADIQ